MSHMCLLFANGNTFVNYCFELCLKILIVMYTNIHFIALRFLFCSFYFVSLRFIN